MNVPDRESAPAGLDLRGLRKSFGSTVAVDDVDLTVPAGSGSPACRPAAGRP